MNTLLVTLPAVSMLVGMFAGAWLVHRSHQHASPIPDVGRVISKLISIVRRPPARRIDALKMSNRRA